MDRETKKLRQRRRVHSADADQGLAVRALSLPVLVGSPDSSTMVRKLFEGPCPSNWSGPVTRWQSTYEGSAGRGAMCPEMLEVSRGCWSKQRKCCTNVECFCSHADEVQTCLSSVLHVQLPTASPKNNHCVRFHFPRVQIQVLMCWKLLTKSDNFDSFLFGVQKKSFQFCGVDPAPTSKRIPWRFSETECFHYCLALNLCSHLSEHLCEKTCNRYAQSGFILRSYFFDECFIRQAEGEV